MIWPGSSVVVVAAALGDEGHYLTNLLGFPSGNQCWCQSPVVEILPCSGRFPPSDSFRVSFAQHDCTKAQQENGEKMDVVNLLPRFFNGKPPVDGGDGARWLCHNTFD